MHNRYPEATCGELFKRINVVEAPYGVETVTVTNSHVKKLEVTAMEMFSWHVVTH